MAEGLLDFIKTPEGQGLLSGLFGYAANARQGTPWNNLGRGGVAGLMGYGNALERQDTLAQREQAKKLQDLQAQHYQMQIEAARRADETAKAKQAALPTLWTGGQAARPAYTPFGEDSPFVPMPAKPAVAPTFDWRKALESGYTPDEIAKLAGMQDVGKTEVARTIDVEGPNGEKLVQSVDKFNRPVGNPVPAYMAPEKVDTGGSVQFAKPKAGLTFQKTMTPGEVASNQVALGNLGVAQGNLGVSKARLAFDMSGGAEANKPQYKDGMWVMPPKDLKAGESRQAMPTTNQKDAIDALSLITEAKALIPKSTGSIIGAGIDYIPRLYGGSTAGDDAAGQLKVLEGSLVAKMPKMSGPQSDKDVLLYKQMAAQIGDPTVSADRKMAALKTLEAIMQRNASGGQPASTSNQKVPSALQESVDWEFVNGKLQKVKR